MTDDELREMLRDTANMTDTSVKCENYVILQNEDHYMPEINRCQVILGGKRFGQHKPPWKDTFGRSNISAIAQCSRCSKEKPNAWLLDVPFERFKGYVLGLTLGRAGEEGAAIVISWEGLKS